MSKRGRRRERPQSRAEMVMDRFNAKWDREGTDAEDCFEELCDYFVNHIAEMKAIISVDGGFYFRFIGDGDYCISVVPDDEGATIGTGCGPNTSIYDDSFAPIIDETGEGFSISIRFRAD